jgi:hypothetical protein
MREAVVTPSPMMKEEKSRSLASPGAAQQQATPQPASPPASAPAMPAAR